MKTLFTKTSSLVAGLAFGFLCCAGPLLTTATPPGGGPANDLCANAISVACGDNVSGDFQFATEDLPTNDCGNSYGQGVWYVFAGTGDEVTVETCGSSNDTEITVLEGDCNTLTCVDNDDDGCGLQSTVTFQSTVGTDYYIYVSWWSGITTPGVGEGSFDLSVSCVTPPPAPANDLCADAVTVACGDVVSGDFETATEDFPTNDCGNTYGQGVWYVFAGTGDEVTVETCGSSNDTEITVLEGDCNTLTCVGDNDDGCSLQSTVTFQSFVGTDYYIYVSWWSDASTPGAGEGTFDLSVTCVPPPPPSNDDCTAPIAMECGDVETGFTTFATEASEPACWTDPDFVDPGVWYSFEGDGTDYTITLNSVAGDPVLAITSVCSPGATCDAFNDDANGFNSEISGFTTAIGTTYYIYVSGIGVLDDFELSITSSICEPPANDLCSSAETISCGDVVAGTTINATTDPQITQDCNGGSTGAGAWYTYVGNGGEVTVTTCSANSTMDTELGVYSGACGSLTCVDFNDDDSNCGNSTLLSTVTFTSTYGETYFFRVAPWSATSGTPGDFEISVTCVCPTSDAGTLVADATPVCLDGTTTISATEGTAPTVPAGFAVAYVLTDGDSPNLDILDVSLPPSAVSSFDVTAGGTYIIHTLVFDPNDAATILGESTGVGVATLIGDGTICGSLDVNGAPIIVNAPEVGATVADANPVCLDGGSADIGAESDGNEVVPAGYSVVYVLTDADNNLEILDANATGDFSVNAGGNYIIHTFVYDPVEVPDLTPFVGQSATVVVDAIANGVCAALDVAGAPITVNAPEVGATVADATPVCLDGGSADIGAESDGNEVVPAGYSVVYVLTDADNNLEILDANATGDFTVNAGGNYIIHTFVYDPVEVPDLTPFVGQSATVVVDAIANGVCAALDVAGAPITVNAPEVGATVADATPVCLDGGSADIGAASDGNEVVPAGFTVVYVLTDADNNLEILDANATGDFTVSAEGNYIIHTLVYDPVEVPDLTPFVGQSATVVVDAIANGVCAALDVAGTGNIVVEVCTSAPANDLCDNAEVINCGDVVAGTNVDATEQSVPTSNGGTVGAGVWYTFTGTGGEVTLSTCDDADFDTEINVVTSPDCINYTNVAGNDDGTGCSGFTSEVTFETVVGETYYVYVSDFISGGTDFGTFNLTFTCDPVTGISEALDNGMLVYPNPSNGEFVVEVNGVEAMAQLNVMDLTGRVVYTEAAVLNGNFRKELNLNVVSGTYLLQILTEEGMVTRKLQVK